MSAFRLVTVLGCVSAFACGPSEKSQPAEPQKPAPTDAGIAANAPAPTPKVAFSGSVTGVIRLAPGVSLPLAVLPTSGTADTVVAPGCPAITAADAKRVQEDPQTRGLSPIHVALTGMTAAPPREPVTHDVLIQDCRLRPGLIGAVSGDKLRVTNRSNTAFLPLLPGDAFMQAILPDATREVELKGLGPAELKCGFGSYCGESIVLAVAHSLFAVTDSSGQFSISGVPLDQDLTVHAWHPLFDVADAKFRLSAAEPSKVVEFVLTPSAAAAPPQPAESSKPQKKR